MSKEFQSESIDRVGVVGARTLKRYTEGILVQGFKEISSDGTVAIDYNALVYQVHGSPQAEQDDRDIIDKIRQETSSDDGVKRVILLHRPDEIQQRHLELRDVLLNVAQKVGVVFLGDMHIDDEFFQAKNTIKKVIPHGFFENLPERFQSDPVIIGSHTTWGEMRSVKHAFKLLAEVFKIDSTQPIVGYIGGKPKKDLQMDALSKLWRRLNRDIPVVFRDAHDKSALEVDKDNKVILVDSDDTFPDGLGLTYNLQLYYLEGKVRTGESSGSVHSSVSVPVVLEMNGSETIEDLNVIKVPYGSQVDITSVDFEAGAKLIVDSIKNGDYLTMLKHNLEQSRKFNPRYIASEYVSLFTQL